MMISCTGGCGRRLAVASDGAALWTCPQCSTSRYFPIRKDLSGMSDFEMEKLVRKFQGDLMDAAESIRADLPAFRARWEVMRGYRKSISSERAAPAEMVMLPEEMSSPAPRSAPPAASVTLPEDKRKRKASKIWLAPAEEVIAAYDRLQALGKVAEEYGCSRWVAKARLEKLGVVLPGRRAPRTEAHKKAIAKGRQAQLAATGQKMRIHTASREEVLEAYDRLGTASAVAREFNTFPNTAGKRLKAEGVDVGKNRGFYGGASVWRKKAADGRYDDDAAVLAVYKRLKTSAATAAQFGVSQSTMKRRLNGLGICLSGNRGGDRRSKK